MNNLQKRPFNLRFGLLAGITALLLLVQIVGLIPGITTPIERVEFSAQDAMMRLRGKQKPSHDIVIVAIDDFSFNWTGYHWPWPRSYLAEIVDQINKGGGKVVGVDIILSEPDPDPKNDLAFTKSLGNSTSSVSVVQISKNSGEGYSSISILQPTSQYRSVLDSLGITAVNRDQDAIARSIQAFDTYQDKTYYNWAFSIAQLYLNADAPILDDSSVNKTLRFNGQIVPLHSGDQMTVDYLGPAKTFTTYSASDVHDGVVLEQDPNAFRDKIVLIGATSVSLQDIYPTPFSAQNLTPGVEVVANAVETILSGSYVHETAPWIILLLTIVAALIAAGISSLKRPTLTVVLMSVAMLGYAIAVLIYFIQKRLILPLVAPEIMLFLGIVLPTLEQAVSQELEKRRVRSLFSRFISPEMVDQMMTTQDLNSLNKRSDVTIIFSDIRGFTTLSEKLPPEDVVSLLNPYLEVMSNVIYKHGGTVDKYEGDAIIAFFGEPVPYKDHASRALRASLDMRVELDKLRQQWKKEGRSDQIEMGIGINSGEVFVGLLGSAQRINYTVIGDNANLASRLQDLTKTYAWPVLISESTYQQVKDEFDAELVDAVVVKGKTQPVNVYKVLGRKGAPKSEQLQSWQK